MRKLLLTFLLFFPLAVSAQLTVPQGGTGTTTFTQNWVLIGGPSTLRVTAVATSTLGLLASTSINATAPLQWNSSTGVLSITQSGLAADGYLSSTNFNVFNNKISSTSLSGTSPITYSSSTGVIACPTCSTATFGYPFTTGTTYATTTAATTTSIWTQGVFFASSTVATSTFDGSVHILKNLQVDGNFFAPAKIVSSGNATINGTLTVTGQTTLATSLSGIAQLTSGVVSAITGTVGQIPYYNGTNTALSTSTIFISTASQVGIRTASPSKTLEVNGDLQIDNNTIYGAGGYLGAIFNSNGGNTTWTIGSNPSDQTSYNLQVNGTLRATQTATFDSAVNVAGNFKVGNNKIYGTGDVLGAIFNSNGGNTTWTMGASPADQVSYNLQVNGSAAKSSGGGTWTDISDQRLKDNIAPVTDALNKLSQLKPVDFTWRDPTNHYGNTEAPGGFIAQQVMQVFPEFVNQVNCRGEAECALVGGSKVYDLNLPFKFDAYLVAGIQELNLNLLTIASTTASSTPASQSFAASFFSNLFARVTTWLADAGNGIADIFATRIHATTVYAQELCLGNTCVDESQLKVLLQMKARLDRAGL